MVSNLFHMVITASKLLYNGRIDLLIYHLFGKLFRYHAHRGFPQRFHWLRGRTYRCWRAGQRNALASREWFGLFVLTLPQNPFILPQSPESRTTVPEQIISHGLSSQGRNGSIPIRDRFSERKCPTIASAPNGICAITHCRRHCTNDEPHTTFHDVSG